MHTYLGVGLIEHMPVYSGINPMRLHYKFRWGRGKIKAVITHVLSAQHLGEGM